MCAESKILTGLLERRALDAAIGELAEISDPVRLAERVEFIAQQGNAVLPALVSALDTNDPLLRGGLGQLAQRLPREQVIAALQSVARSPERAGQARLTALTILERFFDEPPDEALLAKFYSSEEIARQSLSELVHAMTQDPWAILEYLAQLAEQPPEVPRMILGAVPSAPFSSHLVTLLRMFAQDPGFRLESEALEHLGRIRAPSAARALTALAATLPAPLATLAARGVRKLQLSGILPTGDDATDAPWFVPARRWRVLMSPVDGAGAGVGAQLLWFIGHAPGDERALVISVVIEAAKGLRFASGSLDMALVDLPPARPIGSLHRLTFDQHQDPLLLEEASVEMGHRALQEALAANWASSTPTPQVYRLLNLAIWLAVPAEAAELPGDSMDEAGHPQR